MLHCESFDYGLLICGKMSFEEGGGGRELALVEGTCVFNDQKYEQEAHHEDLAACNARGN